MKKPVTEYTNDEIAKRLAFADRLVNQLEEHGKSTELPPHLEREKQELLQEQSRRQQCVAGDGI